MPEGETCALNAGMFSHCCPLLVYCQWILLSGAEGRELAHIVGKS